LKEKNTRSEKIRKKSKGNSGVNEKPWKKVALEKRGRIEPKNCLEATKNTLDGGIEGKKAKIVVRNLKYRETHGGGKGETRDMGTLRESSGFGESVEHERPTSRV